MNEMSRKEFYDMLNDYHGTTTYLTEEKEMILERAGLLKEWGSLIFRCKGCGFWFSREDEGSTKEVDICTAGCED